MAITGAPTTASALTELTRNQAGTAMARHSKIPFQFFRRNDIANSLPL